jgi:hypothetical protein
MVHSREHPMQPKEGNSMGETTFHDTYKAESGASPGAHQLFTRARLGASQMLAVEAVGLRIDAEPEVIAIVARHLGAHLVIDGVNQADFPAIEAGALTTPLPPPPATPDPSPDDLGADAEPAPDPTPVPEPVAAPVDSPVDSGVPEGLDDPFAGQGRARFAAASAEMRGIQHYRVNLTFADGLWSELGERTFEVVAYLFGTRR